MEKEIVWTEVAQKDFWEISVYLKENWTQSVLNNFSHALFLKIQLLQKHPNLGFKHSILTLQKNTRYKALYDYLFCP